jgi:hypothetical protein
VFPSTQWRTGELLFVTLIVAAQIACNPSPVVCCS